MWRDTVLLLLLTRRSLGPATRPTNAGHDLAGHDLAGHDRAPAPGPHAAPPTNASRGLPPGPHPAPLRRGAVGAAGEPGARQHREPSQARRRRQPHLGHPALGSRGACYCYCPFKQGIGRCFPNTTKAGCGVNVTSTKDIRRYCPNITRSFDCQDVRRVRVAPCPACVYATLA